MHLKGVAIAVGLIMIEESPIDETAKIVLIFLFIEDSILHEPYSQHYGSIYRFCQGTLVDFPGQSAENNSSQRQTKGPQGWMSATSQGKTHANGYR